MSVGGAADRDEDEALIKKAMGEHDAQMHGGKHTKLKLRKDGGAVEGESAKPRNDRLTRAEGGGAKRSPKHSQVNVIIAGGHGNPAGGDAMAHPMMPPMGGPPIHPPMMPPGAPPPGPPMMPPPGPPGPPGMPPGGPPPGMGGPPGMPRPPMAPGGIPPRKHGGAIGRKHGGSVSDNSSTEASRKKEQMGPYARKSGGGVGSLDGKAPRAIGVGEKGSGGGLGRLAKIKAYGSESEDGEGSL